LKGGVKLDEHKSPAKETGEKKDLASDLKRRYLIGN
jgi:hypothetical protein